MWGMLTNVFLLLLLICLLPQGQGVPAEILEGYRENYFFVPVTVSPEVHNGCLPSHPMWWFFTCFKTDFSEPELSRTPLKGLNHIGRFCSAYLVPPQHQAVLVFWDGLKGLSQSSSMSWEAHDLDLLWGTMLGVLTAHDSVAHPWSTVFECSRRLRGASTNWFNNIHFHWLERPTYLGKVSHYTKGC